jgi:hypothetical protein
MYVAPRPLVEDDPFFAVRLASAAVLGFLVAMATGSQLPVLYPALIVGLMAGMRKRFDPKKAFGGPIIFILMVTVQGGLISLTMHRPLVFALCIFLIFFLSFYGVVKSGNPVGSLIAIFTVLMSVLGAFAYEAMAVLRDATREAAVFSAVVIPLLYLLLPPATAESHVEVHIPGHDDHLVERALIRAGVLLFFCLWLYAVLDSSNLILAVAAVYVLCFPTPETLYAEARERSLGTLYGGITTAGILVLLSLNGHLFVLAGLVALASLWFGSKMMNGRHPPAVYQFALSVTISLVGGALTNQDPVYATVTRVFLTFGGAISAAFLIAFLETALFARPSKAEAPVVE